MRCSFSVANGYSDKLFATSAEVSACLSAIAITNKIMYTFVNGNFQQYLGLWSPICISYFAFEPKGCTALFITHFYLWVAAKDTVCCGWVAALF